MIAVVINYCFYSLSVLSVILSSMKTFSIVVPFTFIVPCAYWALVSNRRGFAKSMTADTELGLSN